MENQTPPKKSGCWSGCLKGCLFTTILFVVIAGVSSYFAYQYIIKKPWGIEWADQGVAWTYQNQIRPMVIEKLGTSVTPEEKARTLALLDSGVEKYLKLPPEQKRILLKEFIVAYYYYRQGQVIPPEKIQHLYPFIQEHMRSFDAPSPEIKSP